MYRRNPVEESFLVSAVAEPTVVVVLSGTAAVEEREFGGPWIRHVVAAGDFFLTTSPTPYELRWQVMGGDPFETCHVYVSLALFARAFQDVTGSQAKVLSLREVSGERDSALSSFVELLRAELMAERNPSPLYVSGIAQSLAVHLVRHYPAPGPGPQRQRLQIAPHR